MTKTEMDGRFDDLGARAQDVALLLGAMSNPKRLMVLCALIDHECSAGDLAAKVQLSPAALSQHLGKMRLLGLVAAQRDGQTIRYGLASEKVRILLQTLHRLYCAPPAP